MPEVWADISQCPKRGNASGYLLGQYAKWVQAAQGSAMNEIPQEPVSFFRWPRKNRTRAVPLAFIPSQHVRFVLASAEMRARESAWWATFWDRFLTVPDYTDVNTSASE